MSLVVPAPELFQKFPVTEGRIFCLIESLIRKKSHRKLYGVLQNVSVSSHLFSVMLSEGTMSWKLHSLLCFQDQSSNKAGITLYISWPSFLTRKRFFLSLLFPQHAPYCFVG